MLNEFVNDSVNYLSTLKASNNELLLLSYRKTGFLGLIISLLSVKCLFNELVVNSNMMNFF